MLRDISVTAEPGQKVALVGPTGSGKSTLAKLFLGLYTPSEGEILYDGLPLHAMKYSTLRSQFGVVLQEPFLFSGSVRQNIGFNAPGISLESVMEASKLAAIHEEIMQMPMGYETMVAEGGSRLSGGQRQRLAIARALAHRPVILVLDEAALGRSWDQCISTGSASGTLRVRYSEEVWVTASYTCTLYRNADGAATAVITIVRSAEDTGV